jgi:hypothetical protein
VRAAAAFLGIVAAVMVGMYFSRGELPPAPDDGTWVMPPGVTLLTAGRHLDGPGATVNYMISGGVLANGREADLGRISRLAFFAVGPDTQPALLHQVDTRAMGNAGMTSGTLRLDLPQVPALVVSALELIHPADEHEEVVLQAFRIVPDAAYPQALAIDTPLAPVVRQPGTDPDLPSLAAAVAANFPVTGDTSTVAPPAHPVLALESWMRYRGETLEADFRPLADHIVDVRHLWLGASADHLDRRIDVIPRDQRSGRIDASHIPLSRALSSKFDCLAPTAGGALFVQLELNNGTRSEIREVVLPPDRPALLPLRHLGGDVLPPGFSVHAGALRWQDDIAIHVIAPSDTVYAAYGFNHGPLKQCRSLPRIESPLPIPLEGATLQLHFRLVSGEELGPWSFALEGVDTQLLPLLKAEATTRRHEMLRARRFTFAPEGERAVKKAGLGPETRAQLPGMVVEARGEELARLWGAIDAVLLAESPAALLRNPGEQAAPGERVRSITVQVRLEDLIQPMDGQRPGRRGNLESRWSWHTVLPPDWDALHAAWRFRDGSPGAPFEVPVERVSDSD